MSKRWTISDEEAALFRQSVDGAQPIRHDKVEHPRKPAAPRARFRHADNAKVMQQSLDDTLDLADFGTGENLFYARPGIDKRVLKRMRRGQLAVHGECDLHGLSVAQAEREVKIFLAECHEHHIRCARIIHGKGLRSGPHGAVLKTHVGYWLSRRDDIAAYCSARPADGGTGAMYVLLV